MLTRRETLALLTFPAAAFGTSSRVGLGFSLYGMKNLAVPDGIRTCAGIGYDGVEVCISPGWSEPASLSASKRREIRDALTQTGIALHSLMEHLSLLDREMPQKTGVDRIRRASELGHTLMPAGRPLIETVTGGKSAEWESEKQRIADRLNVWGETAKAQNVTICIKAHAGAAIDTPEKLLWLYRQVGNPAVKLTYDYSHFVVRGLPLAETLHQLIPYSAFISVKDATGTADHPHFLLPGDGDTNYAAYFRDLKSTGYSGPIVAEASAQLQVLPSYDSVAAAKKCYAVLSRAIAEARLQRTGRRDS